MMGKARGLGGRRGLFCCFRVRMARTTVKETAHIIASSM